MTTRKTRKLRVLHFNAQNRDLVGYRVTVYQPLGVYPEGVTCSEKTLFWADSELVFSVVHGTGSWKSVDQDLPYSEFDWIFPEMLRFLASILLCEKIDSPKVQFYPLIEYRPLLDKTELDLSARSIGLSIKQMILEGLDEAKRFNLAEQQLIKKNAIAAWRRRKRSPHQALLGLQRRPYSLVSPTQFNLSRQQQLWNELAPKDFVLMRGLYALIKGDMLFCHREFCEEATICTYIALESSFRLVVSQLQRQGVRQPTARDAAIWLYENFDKAYGHEKPDEGYFEEFYNQRIMTLHPSSRFGDFPFAPIMHDDFMHLRRSLPQLFAYLVTRQHPEDFFEDVARNRRPPPAERPSQ